MYERAQQRTASAYSRSLAVAYRATFDAMQRVALWTGQVKLTNGGSLGEPSYIETARGTSTSQGGGSNRRRPGVLGPEDLEGHFQFMLRTYGQPRLVGGNLVGPAVTVG